MMQPQTYIATHRKEEAIFFSVLIEHLNIRNDITYK